jgi:HPt (histidine-containing phosphotransfer) domain-containing protein
MTIEECYAAMDGDYQGVLSRLGNAERIQRFAIKFIDDKTFENLAKSFSAEDWEEAFRAAHTLKGVGQNLGFKRLYESSHDLTEALRGGKKDNADELFIEVTKDYQLTIEALKAL